MAIWRLPIRVSQATQISTRRARVGVPSQPIVDRLPRTSRAGKLVLIVSLVAGILSLFPLLAQAQSPAQGQAVFDQKCKSCHTIGGGRMAGPDLKGITAQRDRNWLIEFSVSPDQVIARGDPTATDLVKQYNGMKMPNMGLTRQDAEAVLDYIAQQSGGAQPGAAQPPAGAPSGMPQPAAAGDPSVGRDLYTGAVSLSNGGPACMACHNVNGVGALGGGNLGKDLTASYTTFGEQGLASILQTAPFPVMKEVYADHGLTDKEVADLLAFFSDTAGAAQPQPANPTVFVALGVAGFLVLLVFINIIWARRPQGVRRALVRGGSR
ncbi:MAG: c-type cytochrome [Chloroflexota bacterium]|nr:MAG: c-type cytochrome [Chloroflexota bacterium]